MKAAKMWPYFTLHCDTFCLLQFMCIKVDLDPGSQSLRPFIKVDLDPGSQRLRPFIKVDLDPGSQRLRPFMKVDLDPGSQRLRPIFLHMNSRCAQICPGKSRFVIF